MVRSLLKAFAEAMMTSGGGARLARLAHREDVAILSYHNVVPDAEAGRGDASLHLPRSAFVEQVERLARTHRVVPLGEPGEAGGRPRAVITFDDAYLGAVELALPVLARLGLPATVFVVPGLLGRGTFWWDELGEAGVLDEETRERALGSLHGRGDAVRRAFLADRAVPALPESYRAATEAELLAQAGAGVTLGSHTWSHVHLPTLPPDERDPELARPLAWVRERGDDGIAWLALPYGRGSDDVARAALGAGYEGVLEIAGGLWREPDQRASVPRINVPAGLSARGLELRTSGVIR